MTVKNGNGEAKKVIFTPSAIREKEGASGKFWIVEGTVDGEGPEAFYVWSQTAVNELERAAQESRPVVVTVRMGRWPKIVSVETTGQQEQEEREREEGQSDRDLFIARSVALKAAATYLSGRVKDERHLLALAEMLTEWLLTGHRPKSK